MLAEIQQVQKNARLLHSKDVVEAAIDTMAEQINTRLSATNPVLLCVMNGGLVLAGKLLTRLDFPLTVDSINVSRYGLKTSGNQLNWLYKPACSLHGRTVLIIDDILDQGVTLKAIMQYCQDQQASQIYSAVLVEKQLGLVRC